MASSIGAGRARTVFWLLLAAALIVAILDTGSIVMSRMTVDDHAKISARAAAQQAINQPINQATALAAYEAAQTGLGKGESIVQNGPGDAEDFMLNQNGSIRLTVKKTAPTLVFKFVGPLKKFTHVSQTYTQEKIGF